MAKPSRQDRFLSLLEGHKRILFKITNSYCRNATDREDLVQEMILQLWRSYDRYDDRRRFSTWMYRVALNVAISFHRREIRRSRKIVPVDDAVLEVAAEPRLSAAQEEELEILQRFIEQLDELDRALVILYLDGNKHEDIAEVLGITKSNVGTKIGRIKQRMRDWSRDVERGKAHGTR